MEKVVLFGQRGAQVYEESKGYAAQGNNHE